MTTVALPARFDVLSVAMQELARVVAPAQATQVASAVMDRVSTLAHGPMSTAVVEAVTAELAPLRATLHKHQGNR